MVGGEPGALEEGKGGPNRSRGEHEKGDGVSQDKLLLCFHFSIQRKLLGSRRIIDSPCNGHCIGSS